MNFKYYSELENLINSLVEEGISNEEILKSVQEKKPIFSKYSKKENKIVGGILSVGFVFGVAYLGNEFTNTFSENVNYFGTLFGLIPLKACFDEMRNENKQIYEHLLKKYKQIKNNF